MSVMFRSDIERFPECTPEDLRSAIDRLPPDSRLMPTAFGTIACYTPPAPGGDENSWFFGYIDLADGAFHPATEAGAIAHKMGGGVLAVNPLKRTVTWHGEGE